MTLAERAIRLGGRLLNEATLPGLGNWMRVRDYREHMISKLPNVEVFRGSAMSAQDIVDFGADHVVLATGSSLAAGWHWRGAAKTPANFLRTYA